MKIVTLALLAPLLGCRPSDPPPRGCDNCQAGSQAGYVPNIVMKTYKVPTGQEKLVERLLHDTTSYPISVVSAQGAQTQLINPKPHFTGNGYFVLSAPENIQEGVRQLMDELAKNPPAPAPASIDATYWLVVGYPSKDTTVSDRLAELAPVVKSLGNLGAMRYELLERLEVVGIDGDEVRTQGQSAELKQTASRDNDSISLRIEINAAGDPPGKIDTTVTVKPGQFAVFGQSGFVPRGQGSATPPATDAKPTLFYVVRARPAT
jgi:hypothetical protein